MALDFRGFGKSHGPGDSDMFTAPTHLDVLAAVHYLRDNGAKSVAVMGGSFGGQRRRMRVLRRDRERLTASYFLQQPEINQRNKSMFRC